VTSLTVGHRGLRQVLVYSIDQLLRYILDSLALGVMEPVLATNRTTQGSYVVYLVSGWKSRLRGEGRLGQEALDFLPSFRKVLL
jgi:hypothetical protein